MKIFRVLLASAAVMFVISQQPQEVKASPRDAAVMAAQAAPGFGMSGQTGANITKTATTTATPILAGGCWTTIKNFSTTTDLICDFCTGFAVANAFLIGDTATSYFPKGIANFAASSDSICCKVASGTLAYAVSVPRVCQ